MTHFIRTKQNKTLIECEVSKNDLSASVDIRNYSDILLGYVSSSPISETAQFVNDVSDLSGIRGWWFEIEEDTSRWRTIDDFVAAKFKEFATKWQLGYVTD